MATRMFFSQGTLAPVTPPAPSADWEHISGAGSRKLLQSPDTSTLTSTAYTPDAADHLVSADAHHRTFVSDGLTAQTLTGNVKAQFQGLEANAGNNVSLTLKVLVISNDGTTVLNTLLAITRDATELATALTNRIFDSVAMGSYACAAGDRLAVEVGVGGTPTGASGTQGHNGTLRFGCNASSGDLPENDTETGTTFRPWIEFANTFTFQLLGHGPLLSDKRNRLAGEVI